MSSWIASLSWPARYGAVLLMEDGTWRATEDAVQHIADQASRLSGLISYRPSDGDPNYHLANRVAQMLEAKVEFSRPPEYDPKVVY